ncbi:HEPN domain-containing protein [Candidatus Poribacteria bacterium]|nr:HEPN domain-containing protein [Candidatus Poribacteria bacterium]
MNPKDFLILARELHKGGKAARRTAVSRAYYAAHHMGRRLLQSIGIDLSRPAERREIHVLTYSCFNQSGNDALVEAGRLLRDLHASRIEADYELDKEEIEDEAVVMDCLDAAEEIIGMLEADYPADTLEATKNTIEFWRKVKYGR